ncbi:ChbG/HpnK family deacetylase [Lacibacter luteus]|uniref:ChbG/HpnK family deacetylase n=1 Tax=Lacibacter luteus TaxID=2508719 RepID=A0A4Q1CN16_9BACT|nr:ChbG/HpnK family deacetylase [Lacibacter luteus]RXK62450.1 ChbG/HpnK family deacetylase [Lacibacter luteus]
MKLHLQADDAGIGKQATEMILDAWEQDMINGFGIVSNKNCGELIKATLTKNKERVCIISAHLNLTDGAALSTCNKTTITSAEGRLNTGFVKAFFYLLINGKRKKQFLNDVYKEWNCQLSYIKEITANREVLVINGHNHIHMLPSLFGITNQLAQKYNIPYVRVIQERVMTPGKLQIHRLFFWKNFCKLIALRICRVIIQIRKMKYQPFTQENFGVLYSGHITGMHLQNAIRSAEKRRVRSLEVILHPGQSQEDEMQQWASFKSGKDFFTHTRRRKEWEALKQLKEANGVTDLHY